MYVYLHIHTYKIERGEERRGTDRSTLHGPYVSGTHISHASRRLLYEGKDVLFIIRPTII